MHPIHKIQCGEIWGGNQGSELMVETSGIRGCLYSRACDGGKGGDIYYFSVCKSDLLTRIAIVDVVGHGQEVSETSRWLYDSLRDQMDLMDGSGVLDKLNLLTYNRGDEATSTATVATFYRSQASLYFSYAGHHELLLRDQSNGQWQSLEHQDGTMDGIEGLPLGVVEDCHFHQHTAAAELGDRLFVYTDGLIEAMSPEEVPFGIQRVMAILDQVGDQDMTFIRQTLLDALLRHTGGSLEHDDVTFMIIEFASSQDTQQG